MAVVDDRFEILETRQHVYIVYKVRCTKCGFEDWKRADVMGPCEFCLKESVEKHA